MWNILLVDDEASEREGMKFLIKRDKLPMNILEASNGKQAFEMIQNKEIDILLTDIKMPYMDGLELSIATYLYNPEIQIIIFSAYNDFDYAKKALQAQVINYLLKPIELEEFTQVMQTVISNCEKKNLIREQTQILLEADKKVLLHRLLTGRASPKLLSQLENHKVQFSNRHIILINAETRNSFFEDGEPLFLSLLSRYAPCEYEYFNLYPNESFLLFLSPVKIPVNRLEHMYQEISRELRYQADVVCSFLVSRRFEQIESLSYEVSLMQKVKKEVYDCEPKLMWVSDYDTWDLCPGEIENIRSSLYEAIHRKNIKDMESCIEKLVSAIAASKSMSVIYMHHIFYDLINRAYTEFGIYDSDKIHERINRVVNSLDYTQLQEALLTVISEISQIGQSQQKDCDQVAEQVKKIIQQEYSGDLSLDYIAQKVNFTSSYLSYLFKKETGDNLVKYITDFRMEKAAYLLGGGNKKVVEVAKLCGYENQSYFNRLFKNYFGVSPKLYKEKNNDQKNS